MGVTPAGPNPTPTPHPHAGWTDVRLSCVTRSSLMSICPGPTHPLMLKWLIIAPGSCSCGRINHHNNLWLATVDMHAWRKPFFFNVIYYFFSNGSNPSTSTNFRLLPKTFRFHYLLIVFTIPVCYCVMLQVNSSKAGFLRTLRNVQNLSSAIKNNGNGNAWIKNKTTNKYL